MRIGKGVVRCSAVIRVEAERTRWARALYMSGKIAYATASVIAAFNRETSSFCRERFLA